MTRKNWALAIILFVLITIFGLMISRKGPSGNIQVDKTLFAVADTAALESIVLKPLDGREEVRLERRNNYWLLNDKYPADPAMMRLMLNVLHDVRVRRPVAVSQQQEVNQQLSSEGVLVNMNGARGGDFIAGGNEADRISYFSRNDEAYVVEFPGYSSYVSGIFALSESDLRNKMLATLNSMNFQALDVQYPADTTQNVSIRYRNNMLGVQEVARPDSSVLFQYMMIYEPFQISGYLTLGEDAAYDSLLQTQPLAIFRMQTVGNSEGLTLHLFPQLAGKRDRLAYIPKQKEAVLIDERLAQAMLIQRRDLLLGR